MAVRFSVTVLDFSDLHEIGEARSPADYAALLDKLDVGDTSDLPVSELREMCLMSLQDLEPDEAAAVVLAHDFAGELRSGQISQMSHAMCDEKLWEEYPEMDMHERLFRSGSLLYAAFPAVVPESDAVQVTLLVKPENADARALLAGGLTEPLVVRLLADGMEGGGLLRRLFDEQLDGSSFPEASTIAWIVTSESLDDGSARVQVTSSSHWLDPLRETRSYESSAHADDVDTDE